MLIDWHDFWTANHAPYTCFVCGNKIREGEMALVEYGWIGGSFSIPNRPLYFHPNCLETFCKSGMNEIRRLRRKREKENQ